MNDFAEIFKALNDALSYKETVISGYRAECDKLHKENEALKERVHRLETTLRETSSTIMDGGK